MVFIKNPVIFKIVFSLLAVQNMMIIPTVYEDIIINVKNHQKLATVLADMALKESKMRFSILEFSEISRA